MHAGHNCLQLGLDSHAFGRDLLIGFAPDPVESLLLQSAQLLGVVVQLLSQAPQRSGDCLVGAGSAGVSALAGDDVQVKSRLAHLNGFGLTLPGGQLDAGSVRFVVRVSFHLDRSRSIEKRGPSSFRGAFREP